MKKIKSIVRRVLAAVRRVNVVDRYLIVIMGILWLHCCLILLFPRDYLGKLQNVDVMVRTSLSSVFGYFLSTNFLRPKSPGPSKKTDARVRAAPVDAKPPAGPTNAIGFQGRPESPVEEIGRADGREESCEKQKENLQVKIVGCIGILSLLILIARRQINITVEHPVETIAASAQSMRDLVSGSIGFLIGYVEDGEE